MKNFVLTIIGFSLLMACTEDPSVTNSVTLDLPETPYEYSGDNNQATLGRVLFYDPQLSVNNGVSCASCHKQGLAFADNVRFSKGFDNRNTLRNSMPIQNLQPFFDFSGDFLLPSAGLFWDGRGFDHNTDVLQPVVNHIEMGITDLNALADKIESIDYYPELFQNAFGTRNVNPEMIGFAINSFLISIQSNQTRLDRFLRNGADVLSAKERVGMNLFFTTYDCNSCHQVQEPDGYLFAGTFANIGLDEVYDDPGFSMTSNSEFDQGKFKIPSLRNVALTGPYMHDGRFATLDEVIKHYSTDVKDHPNLDPRLKDEFGNPIRFEIADHEVSAIKAFLQTLTDYEMITDERFSNPFVIE